MLLKISDALHLSPEEQADMFDLAGRDRNEAAPDLPEYIMDMNLPHVRTALRKANDKGLVDRKSISYTNWWFKIFHLVLPMVDDRCLIDFIEIFVDTIN